MIMAPPFAELTYLILTLVIKWDPRFFSPGLDYPFDAEFRLSPWSCLAALSRCRSGAAGSIGSASKSAACGSPTKSAAWRDPPEFVDDPGGPQL